MTAGGAPVMTAGGAPVMTAGGAAPSLTAAVRGLWQMIRYINFVTTAGVTATWCDPPLYYTSRASIEEKKLPQSAQRSPPFH
eukprot:4396766-Pyramimonas_sp.AAC.1